jgi:hypothetical protein
MKPACGSGTWLIRFFSNHSIGLLVASSVHAGRVDAAVHRAGHQGQAARLGRVVVLGHDGGGGQRRHAGLADGHHVRARADGGQEADHVVDVVVQAKAPCAAHIAGVVPVGDVDVVVLQQRAHGLAQQRGEVARQRRHQQHRRLVSSPPGGPCGSAAACQRAG